MDLEKNLLYYDEGLHLLHEASMKARLDDITKMHNHGRTASQSLQNLFPFYHIPLISPITKMNITVIYLQHLVQPWMELQTG